MSTLRLRALALSLCFFAPRAGAVDYRSVGVPAAILYDAPSLQAKKLYLIKAQTPVEAVVKLDGWIKVRDAEGTLAWIEAGVAGQRARLSDNVAALKARIADLERQLAAK